MFLSCVWGSAAVAPTPSWESQKEKCMAHTELEVVGWGKRRLLTKIDDDMRERREEREEPLHPGNCRKQGWPGTFSSTPLAAQEGHVRK